jgi:hypothetical protein
MRCVIYNIAKHYRKVNKYSPKTLEEYRKRDMKNSKFLNAVFKDDEKNSLIHIAPTYREAE